MSSGQVSLCQTAGSNHYAYPPLRDPKIAVRPLVEKLGQYDRMRAVLEQQGTDRGFWKAMTEVLSEKIVLRSDWFRYAVALTEPEAVKSAVRAINYDLHLEIRQRSTLIPAYYLCRTKWDYWSEYGLIVEDLYASPGYPFHDERLVKLMQAGHEVPPPIFNEPLLLVSVDPGEVAGFRICGLNSADIGGYQRYGDGCSEGGTESGLP